jgi:hypothetical protein
VGSERPDIRVGSLSDGWGLLLEIANPTPAPVTVWEPHPHTHVQLYDPAGREWRMHYGVFAPPPRWRVTVPPGTARRRAVVLPRYFLDARGPFEAVCRVPYRAGDREGELTVRGTVTLALPTAEEFYAEAGADMRERVWRSEEGGPVELLPDEAEPVVAPDPRRG